VDVFGGEIRTRAQSCVDSKEVDCQLWKGLCFEGGRKDPAKGCEFVICVSAQMAQR
jgi:hypothetical protein